MDPHEEIAALRARIADIERRAAGGTPAKQPAGADSMAESVQQFYDQQAERDRLRRLRQAAQGWKPNPGYDRAIALRDSGPEGRAMVAQAYAGSWELAIYEDGKRANAELSALDEETNR